MSFLYGLVAAVILLICSPLAQEVMQTHLRAQMSPPATASAQRFIYTGVGPCSTSNCHARVEPKKDSRIAIQQTEYADWQRKDKHAKAI